MSGRVFTNNQARELKALYELPTDVAKKFDYVDSDEDEVQPRFVKYRGEWYDVHDVQVINGGTIAFFPVDKDHPLFGWNGIQTDSMFTGVVFRWLREHEAFKRGLSQYDYIIVGRYSA